jgi:hypothetical protein
VAITPSILEASVALYPNPTEGAVKVNVHLPTSSDLTMSVYNSVGQKVSSHSYEAFTTGTTEFDLSSQAAGIYFLRVESEGKMIVKKIVLQ